MFRVSMTCGEDVHTRQGVVDNRHVAVEKAGDRARRCRIDRDFYPQISQFAGSLRSGRPWQIWPPKSSVRAIRCHTHAVVEPPYEERNANVGSPHPPSRPGLAAFTQRIEIVGPSNVDPERNSATEWRVRGGAGPGSRSAHRARPGRADLRPRERPLRARRGHRGSAGVIDRPVRDGGGGLRDRSTREAPA
jgi:hypothetical protein